MTPGTGSGFAAFVIVAVRLLVVCLVSVASQPVTSAESNFSSADLRFHLK